MEQYKINPLNSIALVQRKNLRTSSLGQARLLNILKRERSEISTNFTKNESLYLATLMERDKKTQLRENLCSQARKIIGNGEYRHQKLLAVHSLFLNPSQKDSESYKKSKILECLTLIDSLVDEFVSLQEISGRAAKLNQMIIKEVWAFNKLYEQIVLEEHDKMIQQESH